jgi:2-oxoglutarate/2-oxoacid ferredoxin oxidoreductase subunit alpha
MAQSSEMSGSGGSPEAGGPAEGEGGASQGSSRSRRGAPREVESVVIRFAGDSGDGMQLTGTEFTREVAKGGSDIATFPDFPAEIRAPAGTTYGVSGFQLQFSSAEVFTAGDAPQVLVAMNPAALRTNLGDLEPGGTVIVDSGSFRAKNLSLAGYTVNPLEDGTLQKYRLVEVDMARAVTAALKGAGLGQRDVQRTRNFFALGLVFWLYDRDPAHELPSIRAKFSKRPELGDANVKVFEAGYAYGDTVELLPHTFKVKPANLPRGEYRNVTGNEAITLGLTAAALLSDRTLLYASYPITPASSILEGMAAQRRYPVLTFQAEDEIAAVTAAIGASFGGAIGVTGTSGPGMALKQEGIGLAVMAELPLVVIDVQRAGPSTGMPTKVEQTDVLQAIVGRNGESPVCVLAPASPAECFELTLQAVRLATRHMCPVILLSDASLANGAEPWLLPDPAKLERIEIGAPSDTTGFQPYNRDPETLARVWPLPGTAGFEHRIGGLEKADGSGEISYDPENHGNMTRIRQEKIDRIARFLPDAEIFGEDQGDLLIVGFGGTYGALRQATRRLQQEGHSVSHMQLRYLSPLQNNVGEALGRFRRVMIAELNTGQLRMILRSRFLVDARGLNKVEGQPFKVREVYQAALALLGAGSVPEEN